MVSECLTCEELLADFKRVDERSEDALDGAEHAAEPQVHQHQEEHHRPERRGGEVGHGLGEGDEGQTCALYGLQPDETRGVTDSVCFCVYMSPNLHEQQLQ